MQGSIIHLSILSATSITAFLREKKTEIIINSLNVL